MILIKFATTNDVVDTQTYISIHIETYTHARSYLSIYLYYINMNFSEQETGIKKYLTYASQYDSSNNEKLNGNDNAFLHITHE